MKKFKDYILESNDSNVEFTIYVLLEHTDEDVERIGVYLDKDEALEDSEDSVFPDNDSIMILDIYKFDVPKNEFINFLDIDEEDFESDDLEDLIDDFKDDVDWENLDEYYNKKEKVLNQFESQNKPTDELVEEVIYYLNNKFRTNRRRGFNKYTTLFVDNKGNLTFDDGNGEYEEVKIRIANHTHNPQHGENDLNVVITNDDKTRRKFKTAKNDLKYDSDYEVEEIADDILNFFK